MIEPLTRETLWKVASVLVRARESDRREMWACHWPDEEVGSIMAGVTASMPTAYIVHRDAVPSACFGARAVRPGVYAVWAFATDDWPLVAFPVTKFLKRCMIPGLHAAGAHRAEALSIADHHAAHRWLEMLGARREATLAGFGRDREDFHLYAWGRDDGAVRR